MFLDNPQLLRLIPTFAHDPLFRRGLAEILKHKKASHFCEAFLVAGTGLEPVTFGL